MSGTDIILFASWTSADHTRLKYARLDDTGSRTGSRDKEIGARPIIVPVVQAATDEADHAFAVTTVVVNRKRSFATVKINLKTLALDPSFGNGGIAVTPLSGHHGDARAVAVEPLSKRPFVVGRSSLQ
jgi:hypothetical protein